MDEFYKKILQTVERRLDTLKGEGHKKALHFLQSGALDIENFKKNSFGKELLATILVGAILKDFAEEWSRAPSVVLEIENLRKF